MINMLCIREARKVCSRFITDVTTKIKKEATYTSESTYVVRKLYYMLKMKISVKEPSNPLFFVTLHYRRIVIINVINKGWFE